MQVREASIKDSREILEWRNDILVREMAFDSSIISQETHDSWLAMSLNSEHRKLFIGILNDGKIGICRFDITSKDNCAEISINMNPVFRGKGLSVQFMIMAIKNFRVKSNMNIIARVKGINLASQKVFKNAGFITKEILTDEILFFLPREKLTFAEVTSEHTGILYEFLEDRKHNISHKDLPEYEDHKSFVENHPYLHWCIIFYKEPIGAFYIQKDNSISININNPKIDIVNEILLFIKKNFKPMNAIPSSVPPYFFLNIASSNVEFIKILEQLELQAVQVSYRLT
jgi:RimJ/RimL family protein N-acetyltransferase